MKGCDFLSDSLAGVDKTHELTIRYLDANYDLTGKSIEDYALEYESTYKKIYSARKEARKNLKVSVVSVLK